MRAHDDTILDRTGSPAARRRGGFSLVELLVVISVIVIVSAALLPAFGRLIESNNYAAAVNSVSAALGSARAVAIQSGKRTGVAFYWDAKREQTTLVFVGEGPRERGVLCGLASTGRDRQLAEILWPVALEVPIELPKGIAVYGLTPNVLTADVINVGPTWDDPVCRDSPPTFDWYSGEVINGSDNDPANNIILWQFPRNDPRIYTRADGTGRLGEDPWLRIRNETSATTSQDEAEQAVRHAQTFLVLFSAEGTIVPQRRSGGEDVFNYYLEFPNEPIDQLSTLPNPQPYDDAGLFDPESTDGVVQDPERIVPNPEVFMRSVDQLAVVDLNRLSEGVGFQRPWLARAQSSVLPRPQWITDGGFIDNLKVRAVSRWIDLNAEIISFNRYTGQSMRRSGS